MIKRFYSMTYSPIALLRLCLQVCQKGKVRTFWETHKIWKNLPHGFDNSADLLSERQNQEEDFFKLCVLLKKSELYQPKISFLDYSPLGHPICPRTKDAQWSLFYWNPELLGLGRQIKQINSGTFGVHIFGQIISTHFGTVSMFSIIRPLFLKKTKPLYPHPRYLFVYLFRVI